MLTVDAPGKTKRDRLRWAYETAAFLIVDGKLHLPVALGDFGLFLEMAWRLPDTKVST